MNLRCPQCGAPPAHPVPTVGQFHYTCPYCRAQSMLGTPAPPPPPQPTVMPFAQPPVIHMQYDHTAVARSQRYGWMIWIVMVVVLSSGAGIVRCATRNSSMLSFLVWNGEEPLVCGGVDEVNVSGVEASFAAGSAIIASGNCKVRCTNCTISAPIAIDASGNAEVTIVNGTVRGGDLLGSASGNAHIDVIGNAQVSGRARETANGKVNAAVPHTK